MAVDEFDDAQVCLSAASGKRRPQAHTWEEAGEGNGGGKAQQETKTNTNRADAEHTMT